MDFNVRKAGKLDIMGAAGSDVLGDDVNLALELSGLLGKHYPGHQWMVHVNSFGGVIDIRNTVICGNYGYRIGGGGKSAWRYTHDALRRKVIAAGGEMLERAKLRRGSLNQDSRVTFVDGVRPQDQPEVLRNIQKYKDLLNGSPAAK